MLLPKKMVLTSLGPKRSQRKVSRCFTGKQFECFILVQLADDSKPVGKKGSATAHGGSHQGSHGRIKVLYFISYLFLITKHFLYALISLCAVPS